jgi:tetratricopeptide (TPR) repeat protein
MGCVERALGGLQGQISSGVIPYLCALVATAFLPFKRRPAYAFVCLALAFFWGSLAWAALGACEPVWAAVAAAAEALLFLSFAIHGLHLSPIHAREPHRWELEFGARSGPWAAAGSTLLVYALLVHPFLGRCLEVQAFRGSACGMPLPAVLFTCGILLFAREPIAALALAIPLVWALAGGPDDAKQPASLVELEGLRVALLVGVAYLLQPPELRRGGERLLPKARYSFATRYYALFSTGLWALSLATVLLFFWHWVQGGALPPFVVNLALLAALGFGLWLAFGAWESLWFRAVASWAARVVGRVLAWLRAAWRWGVLLLAAAALWAILFPKEDLAAPASNGRSGKTASHELASKAGTQPPGTAVGFWRSPAPRRIVVQLFAGVVLLWLAYFAYRGRKRLVIGPFVGCTGDAALDSEVVAGVVPRLQNELASISDVFKIIDEAIPAEKSAILQVTPGVQDIGAILKDASAITFGVLKIPANLLVGLVGQLVSGPRLTGAVHKIDDAFLLTAEISGGGFSGSWKIDTKAPGQTRLPPRAAIHELVVELAFRIATDLVLSGSPRWRAIRAFTEGLRAYRKTQRRERHKVAMLREAERHFIQALDEDQQFTQCHFNLGVVYRQLGEVKSAQSAFRRALRENPDHLDACYALAEALATDKQYARALWFCEAAIAINPHDARVWDLMSYAERYAEQERQGIELALQGDDPAWNSVRSASEIAVALAWRALCWRALAGPSAALKRDSLTALTCTRNLAVVAARSARLPKSLQLFQQAAWLAPRDPVLQVYEGRTFFWSEKPCALGALRGIFADGLEAGDQAMLWSVLAQADARFAPLDERPTRHRLTHTRFLDVIAEANVEDLVKIADLSLEKPPGTAGGANP